MSLANPDGLLQRYANAAAGALALMMSHISRKL
jgi:hypothetical protein